MKIRFYREDNRWYAFLPKYIELGGTKEDCEMVAGADTWLDIITQYGDEITIDLSTTSGANKLILKNEVEDLGDGATYSPESIHGIDYSHHELWLCPVTLFVFGEYPEIIYYTY